MEGGGAGERVAGEGGAEEGGAGGGGGGVGGSATLKPFRKQSHFVSYTLFQLRMKYQPCFKGRRYERSCCHKTLQAGFPPSRVANH